jgi:FtsZ-binding cell division protein ZapB
MFLEVAKIRIDCGTQPRSRIDSELVSHYATLMSEGSKFPPVTVHFDGIEYYLSDGFHRYHAQRRNKKTKIEVNVINGTLRDAQYYSKGANHHGKPMSNEDKRKNVLDILDDIEWGADSDSAIARHCNVSQPFVSKLRSANAPEKITYKSASGKDVTRTRAPTKPEVAKETAKPTEEEDNYDPQQEALDSLVEENDKLRDQLAVGVSEDKDHTAKLIEELRQENKLLKIEVKTLKNSRDTYQAENAQLKRQIASMQRKVA